MCLPRCIAPSSARSAWDGPADRSAWASGIPGQAWGESGAVCGVPVEAGWASRPGRALHRDLRISLYETVLPGFVWIGRLAVKRVLPVHYEHAHRALSAGVSDPAPVRANTPRLGLAGFHSRCNVSQAVRRGVGANTVAIARARQCGSTRFDTRMYVSVLRTYNMGEF